MSSEWPTAAEWLAGTPTGPSAGSPTAHDPGDSLVVAGVPLREGAVTPSRYDLAPEAIRAFLGRLSSYDSERDVDVSLVPVVDLGDGLVPPALDARLTVLLGGHNGVTYEALSRRADLVSWGLLTLDAHHDVREYAAGSPGNGSPVRALVDAGLPGTHVVQVGIAGFSNVRAHRRWCEEIGVTIRGTGAVHEVPDLLDMLAGRCDHVYVDLDIDVLDRAFAPGAPGARPGGITPRELFGAAHEAGHHSAVRAVDIVEVDPQADVASLTVGAAAISLLNIAAGFASRVGRS
jgi:arginase family enzyme